MKSYTGFKKIFLATAALAALVPVQAAAGQSQEVPQRQKATGGKAEFEVASVKQNLSSDPAHSNVNFSDLDASPPAGGLLSAVNFHLTNYILFAYKLAPDQLRYLTPQLPKWATTDRFDVQARARGNPTRDQIRLMLRSLLADRFKLIVHTEIRQLPVFAVVLAKPGKAGPQLTPYSDDPTCADSPTVEPPSGSAATPQAKDDNWFPSVCGAIMLRSGPGPWRVAARNMTAEQIASHLVTIERLDRAVVDQTGLSGHFDFRIEFTPESNGPAPPGSDTEIIGPTFFGALQEQLGLKLVPQIGPVGVLVIDHVEEPSEN